MYPGGVVPYKHLDDGIKGQIVRTLEHGDPAGVPALYFHGTPSSAREAHWLDAAGKRYGVRLVSFDRRASVGSSLSDVARTAGGIADDLGLGSYATIGFSGGAGFALAAAHVDAARVNAVHLAGGIVDSRDLPRGRAFIFSAAARAPRVVRPLIGAALRLNLHGLQKRLDDPRAAARWFFEGPAKGAQLAAVEAYIEASDPEDLRLQLLDMAQAVRSSQAVVADLVAYGRGPGFDLGAIKAPVQIWHGLADPAVPVSAARAVAAALRNSELHLFDGEGHFVLHSHGDELAASIRAAAA
jgi:pimeloyl-ACP methyl ester carboxylesterase